MAQQKCESCGHEITRKEITKSLLKGFSPITCSNCGKVHLVQQISKLIIAMLVTFPIVFFLLLLSTAIGLSGLQTTVVGVILLAITLFASPFIARCEPAENQQM
ncbi:TIGR04104 family putative zinc finger protein [Alkalihalobacterium chitinilyticum]|uniref:Cxxc_20_cxxc protein n=1 Tax=Alkalihalobacterium chitinilyticum TaxID=2980103 RepID=A0ABT5VLJ0_9BACI|nr:TIGR04104 family putative zinc finger protein [Alkalihalobacterium chitinilyticum]MDE5416300.1 hypothetical protein [Alkalihalobacterium chitinilyticum]